MDYTAREHWAYIYILLFSINMSLLWHVFIWYQPRICPPYMMSNHSKYNWYLTYRQCMRLYFYLQGMKLSSNQDSLQLHQLHKKSLLMQITNNDITTYEILCGSCLNLPGTIDNSADVNPCECHNYIRCHSVLTDINFLADIRFSLHQCYTQQHSMWPCR